MRDLSEKYKSYDSKKLLNILAAPEDYLPTAVEAARTEIANRNISQEEIEQKITEISTRSLQKKAKDPRLIALENKTKTTLGNLFDTINPIQKGPFTADKKINLTTLFFGIVSISQIPEGWGMIRFMLEDDLAKWDFSTVLFFIPILFLPIATLFFWKKHKIGWILLGAFLVFTIVSLVDSLIRNWNLPKDGFLRDILPPISLLSYVVGIAVFGGILWVIGKLDMRETFHINRNTAVLTYVLSGLMTLVSIYLLIGA